MRVKVLKEKLPYREGFWNNPGISDGKNIYAISNVEEDENKCVDN